MLLECNCQAVFTHNRVKCLFFETIYELAEGVRKEVASYNTSTESEETIGEIRVLKIFRRESTRMLLVDA